MKLKDNEITSGLSELWEDVKNNLKIVLILTGIAALIAIFLSGFIMQHLATLVNLRDTVTLLGCIKYGLKYGLILTIVIFILFMIVAYKLSRSFRKDYIKDKEGNFEISKSGVHGKAHWQTDKEKEECFHLGNTSALGKNITDNDSAFTGNILGKDKKGRLYSIKDLPGQNKNCLIVGSAGSGKSDAILINWIYQTMARNESIIVTDSKGSIFSRTYRIAKEEGYVVKVLNLKGSELKNSDGCHCA